VPLTRTWKGDLITLSDKAADGSKYVLHIVNVGENYTYAAGLPSKSDAANAIAPWASALTARGVKPLLLITDDGGEHNGARFGEACATSLIAHEKRVAESHVDLIEGAHRIVKDSAMTSLLASDLPRNLSCTPSLSPSLSATYAFCSTAKLHHTRRFSDRIRTSRHFFRLDAA
jgi:hypothetical protein